MHATAPEIVASCSPTTETIAATLSVMGRGRGMPITSRNKALNDAAREEAASLIRRAAEPCAAGEYIANQIARAATRLGLSYRRAEDIWRREAKRIDSWEMDLLRALTRPPKRKRR